MAKMLVNYQPQPIPWNIPMLQGKQTGPGTADITLIVRAINEDTFDRVAGSVTSVRVPPEAAHLVEDPNNLDFSTNVPQNITLVQMTSHEVPPGHPPLFLTPSVKISATGFNDAFLLLE